jgi:AraC-like DNA-binding protein
MSRLIRGMQYKDTLTENAMPTHSTSGDACVDFFAGVGSARNWSEDQIKGAFAKALATDPLVAMRTLFWARDARQGAGERRVFRVCLDYLKERHTEYLIKNLHLVSEFGRWDDIFHLDNVKEVYDLIGFALDCEDGLLAKWLPRKGPFANKVRNFLGMTPKDYRKLIVGLSRTVEQQMCAKEWARIKYEQVPSVAMNKYRKAFGRNDQPRFSNYIESVLKGETTIKAGVLFPYQLYQAFKRRENRKAVEAQWENLPDFMKDNKQRVLPMCDTSSSMTVQSENNTSLVPMDISVSLGIYISERNEGPFKNAFMTFSNRPTLQYLKGSFYDRCRQLQGAHWEMNTNLEAAFTMLLNTAVKENVSEDEMPTVLLILSDMQFDRCIRGGHQHAMGMIRSKYKNAGYELPQVVFWNINARVGQVPVKFNESGTAVVSGCSPTILKSVLDGSLLDPKEAMLKTVMSERYQSVTV